MKWIVATVLLTAACGDDLTHGSCDSGTQFGYTVCDEFGFSKTVTQSAKATFDQGGCPYLAFQQPTALLPSWHPGQSCPGGALGGCRHPTTHDGTEQTTFYYPSDQVKTSSDVKALCGTTTTFVSQ